MRLRVRDRGGDEPGPHPAHNWRLPADSSQHYDVVHRSVGCLECDRKFKTKEAMHQVFDPSHESWPPADSNLAPQCRTPLRMSRMSWQVYDKGSNGTGHFPFNPIFRLCVHVELQHYAARHLFACPYHSCFQSFTTEAAMSQVRPFLFVSRVFEVYPLAFHSTTKWTIVSVVSIVLTPSQQNGR